METQLQDYFNGICCPAPPQGLITLTGGVADGLYTDLASAIAYIQGFTSATITDASLSGDVFKFIVPAGSDFSLVNDFMVGTTGSLVDSQGLISTLATDAFRGSSGDNVLGNLTIGSSMFTGASGNNTIGSILLSNSSNSFADSYTGTMNITGNVGTTEGNDYTGFFPNASGATINVLASKQTSDGGNVEGDIALAQTNGATVNFTL
jgi:hypothetical protein